MAEEGTLEGIGNTPSFPLSSCLRKESYLVKYSTVPLRPTPFKWVYISTQNRNKMPHLTVKRKAPLMLDQCNVSRVRHQSEAVASVQEYEEAGSGTRLKLTGLRSCREDHLEDKDVPYRP